MSPSLDEDRPLVSGGSFHLLHDLFHPTFLHSLHFSSTVTICFKNGRFPSCLSKELHVEIQSRFYSLNLCGIQTSKRLTYQLGGNDFRYLIWTFWVCWLSPKWRNVDCSQLMSWFDCYQLQLVYPTREPDPGRNLQQETLQTSFDLFDQSQHLRHTLEKSFLFFFGVSVAFLLFLK